VIVDAAIPPGAAVEVQTFASDDAVAPAAIPWAPARPVRIPLAGVEGSDGEAQRPVLSDQGRWARKRGEPYLRTQRPIGRLDGTGPVGAAGFAAPWPIARRLRAGDEIELRVPGAGGAAVQRAIASISGRGLRAVVRGALQLYGAGAHLTLVERAGEAPPGGPRLLATFAAGQALDLSGAADDATLYDLPASHAIAALVRDGDVLRIDDGAAAAATIAVDTVELADATVVLALAVAGDFSISDLRIAAAADRLIVDALGWTDGVPAGEPIFVHDDVAGTIVAATLRWAELDTHALWLEPGPPIPWATWTRFSLPEPAATDRGRYLWLRLGLSGAVSHPGDDVAAAGPAIRSVRLLLPRPSFLRYLPAVYGRRDDDDPSGALFLERLLALPEARLTGIEAAYEAVARNLNPAAAPPDWLRFLAAWYGLAFDPSWPLERRRALVAAAHDLFARRGTLDGVRRYLEIYLGAAPAIVEGFQWRVAPPPLLGGERVLGTTALGTPPGGDVALAHHFAIWVLGGGAACGPSGTAHIAKAARAIIDSIKPAHTTYDLRVVDDAPRIGISSSIGIDMVLVGGPDRTPLGPVSRPPPVLGAMTLPVSRAAAVTPRLAPIPLDDDFTLT
jgi:phage tail-like protein